MIKMENVIYSEDMRTTLAIWQEDARYKRNLAKDYRAHDPQKADSLESQSKAIEECIADIEAML